MKKDHLKDFIPDQNGGYVYQGERYRCDGGSATLAALRRRLWPASILSAAALLAGGCIPAPGMGNCVYLLLPYAAEMGTVGSVIWALARLQAGEYPLRGYIYQATILALPGRCMAAAVAAAAGAAGELLYLMLHGSGGHPAAAALYLLLKAASAGAMLWLRRSAGTGAWRMEGAEG